MCRSPTATGSSRAIAGDLADVALEQERIEAFVSRKIHAGAPLWGNYPPGPETVAEYQASLADRA